MKYPEITDWVPGIPAGYIYIGYAPFKDDHNEYDGLKGWHTGMSDWYDARCAAWFRHYIVQLGSQAFDQAIKLGIIRLEPGDQTDYPTVVIQSQIAGLARRVEDLENENNSLRSRVRALERGSYPCQ